MGTSKNSDFAQMQGAENNFAAPHMHDMSARNFFRNAAVEMKCGFLEIPMRLFGLNKPALRASLSLQNYGSL